MRNSDVEGEQTKQWPPRNANALDGTRTREPEMTSVHDSSRFFLRGRNANHHTEMTVAIAPTTPMVDLTPLPFDCSAMRPS